MLHNIEMHKESQGMIKEGIEGNEKILGMQANMQILVKDTQTLS
jgi:hypothetical protein